MGNPDRKMATLRLLLLTIAISLAAAKISALSKSNSAGPRMFQDFQGAPSSATDNIALWIDEGCNGGDPPTQYSVSGGTNLMSVTAPSLNAGSNWENVEVHRNSASGTHGGNKVWATSSNSGMVIPAGDSGDIRVGFMKMTVCKEREKPSSDDDQDPCSDMDVNKPQAKCSPLRTPMCQITHQATPSSASKSRSPGKARKLLGGAPTEPEMITCCQTKSRITFCDLEVSDGPPLVCDSDSERLAYMSL